MLRKLLLPALAAGLLLPAAAHADVVGPPTTFILDSTPDNARLQVAPRYQLDGADPFDGAFKCYLDGAPIGGCEDWDQRFETIAIGQGTHTFSARTVDRQGRIGPLASRTFTLDNVGPDVSFTSKPRTNDTTPELTFSAPFDGGAPYTAQCKLDGAPVPCAWGAYQVTTPLSEGGHTFAVQARDGLGNFHVGAALWLYHEFTIDTTAPAITDVGFSAAAKRVTFALAGAVEVDCSLDGAVPAPCTSPYDVGQVAPGDHTLKIRARDDAGNESEQQIGFDIPTPPVTRQPEVKAPGTGTTPAATTPAPAAVTPAPVAVTSASKTTTAKATKKSTKKKATKKKKAAKKKQAAKKKRHATTKRR